MRKRENLWKKMKTSERNRASKKNGKKETVKKQNRKKRKEQKNGWGKSAREKDSV